MDPIKRSHFINAVYVVQLLGPQDQQTGEILFRETLVPAAKSSGLLVRFANLASDADLVPALYAIAEQCAREGMSPVLHLESHANSTGVGMSAPKVSWAQLRPALVAINTATKLNLLVTMAACYGAYLIRTIDPTLPTPLWGLVGPAEQVVETDVLLGFRAFYRTLALTLDLNAAIDALRATPLTLPDAWAVYTTELIFALAYGHYLATFANPAGRRAAELKVLKASRRRNPGQPRPAGLRASIRRQVEGELNFVDKFRRQFFMIDRFPDNEARFPISVDDCKTLYELHRAGIPNSAA